MIDTRAREPERTWRDVNELLEEAKAKGLVPLGWHLGFFMARDLHMTTMPDWPKKRGRVGQWCSIINLCGLPARVTELEDRIRLVVAPPDPNGHVFYKQASTLDRDRRASGS